MTLSIAAFSLVKAPSAQAQAPAPAPVEFTPASPSPITASVPLTAPITATTTLTPAAYLPIAISPPGANAGCPVTSTATFDLISVQGGFYKNNALTDENSDFRLSILGYQENNQPRQLVEYGGPADATAPQLHGIFQPNRLAQFKAVHKRFDWMWDETAAPPYGARGGVNNDWPVSVLDLAASKGEPVFVPERSVANSRLGTVAIVLYADAGQITLHYGDADRVDSGYTVYLAAFCVDPNLVALYRAQLLAGKRATGQLPAIRNDEKVGAVKADVVTVAIRDSGPFLDPRSRKDWWQGISTAQAAVLRINSVHATGMP
jgi:hypothetical protein